MPISVVVRADDNEDLARQAGATTVINPASFAGPPARRLDPRRRTSPNTWPTSPALGTVALQERQVTPEEVGRAALGDRHRARRPGLPRRQVFGFWDPEAAALQAGDLILEVTKRD